MNDAPNLADLLDRLLAGVQVVRGAGGQLAIGVDSTIPDLIDAHPVLLSPEADAELARRLAAAADEAAKQRLLAVRQVLQHCRQAGGTRRLRETSEGKEEAATGDEATPANVMATTLSLVKRLSGLEERFAEGGVLRAALAVVQGVVLNSLTGVVGADREAIRETMLRKLGAGLPLLWSLQPGKELAGIQGQAGNAYGERRGGDRVASEELSIACFEAALEVYTQDSTPQEWAMTQNNLGVTYSHRLSGNPCINKEKAIACYEASLKVYSREGSPLDWAEAQSNLGTAYRKLDCGYLAENQERAIKYYENALNIYSKETSPYYWAITQDNLGGVLSERSRGDRAENMERAIACSLAALEVFSKKSTPHDWGLAQRTIGATYQKRLLGNRAENQDRAIACYEAALEVYSKTSTPHDWADLHNSLGTAYNERLRGDSAENQEHAIAHYEAALDVYSKKGTPHDWARTQGNLGRAYGARLVGDRSDNQERQIACYEAALEVRSKDDAPHDWANTQDSLGNAYGNRVRGNHAENQDRALACFEAALEVYSKADTPYDWARTQQNLGIAYKDRISGDRAENQERAIACYTAALEIRSKEGTPHEWAMTNNNLGTIFHERLKGDRVENLERAIGCYEAALQVYSEDDTPHDWARTQSNLGNTYCNRLRGNRAENLEQALAYLRASLRVRTKAATPYDWADTQNNLAIVYRNRLLGDDAENQELAIACYQAALEVYSKDGNPRGWAMVQSNLGIAYDNRLHGDRADNLEQAIACWRMAMPLLQLSMPPNALAALVSVGRAQHELGHLEDARAAWREALVLREALLAADATIQTRGEAAWRSQHLVGQLALLESDLGDLHAAIATLERGRAIALRAALSLAWLETLSDDQRAPVARAREVLDGLRANPPSAADTRHPGVVRAWEQAVVAAQAALAAELTAVQAASGFRPPPLDAATLAALAPLGGAVVLLVSAPGRSSAFLLPHTPPGTPPVIKRVPLPQATSPALRDVLIAWNDAYRALLKAMRQARSIDRATLLPANAVLERVLDTLWQDVMGPVLAALATIGLGPGAPLVLLPQGDLALLPLHAAGPDGTGRHVLDHHEVRYVPSGYALKIAIERLDRCKTMRETDADGNECPLIDAAGRGRDLSGAFNPMKGTEHALPRAEDTEMPALHDLFTRSLGQQARCRVGSAATVDQVLADAPRSGYLHLACHGSFDMADPTASGLQLAGDRWLTLSTIVRDLKLDRCRLVSLSACETGMFDVHHLPDEFVGLPAAFLQAGAPGVVATFWTVLDQPTAAVLTRFYDLHLLGKGMPPATALRQAVLDLRNTARATPNLRIAGPARHSLPFDETQDAPPGAPQDPPPDPQHVLDLPIVWTAYAIHGT